MKLHPFWECADAAHKLMMQGATVHQQFNCAHCGMKQTMAEPNAWYKLGLCEECGQETNIEKDGCNYMIYFGRKP